MLYVIGTRSSQVSHQQLPGVACAHCHAPNSLWGTVLARYFFVGFIPAFPVGKVAFTECQRCKQVLNGIGQMPVPYRPPVQAMLAAARVPLTHFALPLLVLVVGALPFLFSGAMLALSKMGAFRPAIRTDIPREVAGTRYVYHYGPGQGYMLLQTTRVTPDSVYCLITGGLRGPLTPATATVALRDSVNPLRGFGLGEWQQFINPQSGYKRL